MRIPAWLSILPLLALLVVAAGSGAGEAPGPPGDEPIPAAVTLEEAVRLALTRSREIRLAGREARIAGEERAKAGAGRLPRLDASGEFTALSEPPSFFLQGREQQFGDRNVTRARITAEQTLYDFGRTSSRIAGAGARAEAAGYREERVRELQAFEAVSAYLAARRAERLRSVAGEALAAARAHRKVAGDLYELGVVAKNDVLAAEVLVANDEAARVTADNRVELSRSRLALALGYPGDASVSPDPGPIPVPAGEVPPLDEGLASASANRREIRAAEAALREGEARAEGARAEFAPSFFGRGGYSYESDSFNPNPHVFSALVGGKVNLFAGGADAAERRESLLEADRRREERALLRDRIALEVKGAYLSVLEAAGRQAAAEVAVARAEENLRIQEDRYREGLSISTEVLDAQTLLSRAKADRENAAFDLYEARFGLLLARGELLARFAPPAAGETAGETPAKPAR